MKLIAVVMLLCGLAAGQAPSKPLDDHPWEFGEWLGGGLSVPGGTKDVQIVNLGIRLGKVLTDDHGPSFLRGNFEWAADLIPVYYIRQPVKNAFGGGFNPVNLKWNFTNSTHAIPYVELGGGVLFTNTEVPFGTSSVNFITHGAVGLHLFVHPDQALTVNTRFEHISNAGLATPNPGINSVQFSAGWSWFR
jgi:lipid A 3-O-deacylase